MKRNAPTRKRHLSKGDRLLSDDPVAKEFPPRIPVGDYRAICKRVETGLSFGGRTNLYFRFVIVGGKFDGIELFMSCRFPSGRISYRHKYYQQWVLANGGPPEKGQKLAREIFPHRLYEIKVHDTKRKHSDGTIMVDCVQYSVVESIIEPLTGRGTS